jgi:hypothetical protein
MGEKPKDITIHFIVESRLLDHIGLAMYSSLPKAISELVANSYDADSENVRVTIPSKLEAKSNIMIEDDGQGMDRNHIINAYMHLGSNNRSRTRTPKFKRLPIGSKGIGKLAGLGIANKMRVITKKDGLQYSFEIDRRELDAPGANLSNVNIPLEFEKTTDPNGTKIILTDLLPHVSSMSDEDLRIFFMREFGFPNNFVIYVNGLRYKQEDIHGKKIEINDTITGCGEVTGLVTIAARPKDIKTPGIITKVRGRAVLGPSLFDINTHGHQYRVADRIFGEIEANFFDPEKPQDKMDQFLIATSRDNFNRNHPKFIAYKGWVESKLISISRQLEKEQAELRKHRYEKEIRSRIEDKKSAERLSQKLLSKISTFSSLSDEEVDTLVDTFISFAESPMKEILDKLRKSDPRDLTKIADLLSEWGLFEIVSVVELIKARVEVLEKFALVTADRTSLEYHDVHKILEENVWLLSDSYKLFSSNRTLKKTIESELAKDYKGHECDRPDLICKTLMNTDAFIIELKKPGYKISSKDISQLIRYKTIIKHHMPSCENIECYLIGSDFDEAVRDPQLAKSGYHLKGFSEIVEDARFRYEEILKILENGKS